MNQTQQEKIRDMLAAKALGRQQDELYEELRRLAARYPFPIDMRRLAQMSQYMQGARQGIIAFASLFPGLFKGKEGPYNKAIYDLVVSDLRHTDLFLSGEYEIRYRNHKNDRRGKLLSCEAYFAKTVSRTVEVE